MSEREKVFLQVDEDTNLDELTDRLIEALFGGKRSPDSPQADDEVGRSRW